MKTFSSLKAVFINCSLKQDVSESHTQNLLNKVLAIMESEGVAVTSLYAQDYAIAFGMLKDGKEAGLKDDWPQIQAQVMEADILVIGTPIWLGAKSSVATLVMERLYAYSGEYNDKGQYAYYAKVGGCVITGNEDGVKHCAMDILYGLQHIGYTIPPQADCGWVGEAGPGPSYGDVRFDDKLVNVDGTPAGYDNDFTNKNTTYMAWNLMHMALLLKNNGGIAAQGNTKDGWEKVANAKGKNNVL